MRLALPLLIGLLALLAPPVQSQVARGTVQEGLTIDSQILGREVRYTVYLPYDYETSARAYPVVYLLHGYGDDDTGWVQFGEAHLIADEGIAQREIPPMILVTPDAATSWYINNHDGTVRFEDFFIEEFMPHVEAQFRIRAERRYRGVAGLSMGGFGALVYGLRHPDRFAAVAAFSPAVYTAETVATHPPERWDNVERVVYGPALGTDRLTDHWRSYNPIEMITTATDEQRDAFRRVRLYMDSGDDDFLYKGVATFHIALRDHEVAHEFRVRDGGHRWSYWRSGLLAGLRFIGTSFHQP
ncbi:MAG: alpha/beta hydrolase-fold protein [Bacteroidota bacterium]